MADDAAPGGPVTLDWQRAELAVHTPGGRTADYPATAICEGDHGVIDDPGVGTTQADTVGDIHEMAVDLVTAMTHTAPQDVHVQVQVD